MKLGLGLTQQSAGASAPADPSFTVTIASGTVGSNLTDFPLMVDLMDMPSSFWSNVRTDGGNIRAYQSDGSTMLPHDVTYIDTTEEQGRMFIRTDLLTGSDNVIIVRLLDTSETKLAPGDANGQYDCWQDFDVVVAFPDTKNRVDDTTGTVGANGGTFKWKEIAQQAYVAHQGVVFDGTYHYAVDTNYLRKYSTGTTVVASNTNPCGDMNTATGETTLNHCGNPCIIDGELWMPVEVYPAGTYNKQYVGRFSLSTLAFLGYIQLTGATRESSSLIEDASASPARIYVTDYTDGSTIPYFNKSTGAYIGAVTLSETLSGIQGIADMGGGRWAVSCDSYPDGPIEVLSDGTVGGYIFKEWYVGQIEGIGYYAPTGVLTFDNGNIRDYQVLDRLHDWRRLHDSPIYFTIPRADTWTIAAGAWFTPTLNMNQGVVAVNNNGDATTATRTGAGYRSTGRISCWNTNDGWLDSSPVVSVVTYEDDPAHRFGLCHEGTTQRRLFADGAVTTDAGVAAKPGAGTNMDVAFGANNAAGIERLYGYMQFAWFRKEAMSNAWMAADAANNRSPATFYTISEA